MLDINYITGKAKLSDGTIVELNNNLRLLGHEYLQSLQIWADTHTRMRMMRGGKELGFVRVAGLDYNRTFDFRFDRIQLKELAMPAVVSITAGTSKLAPLQTDWSPTFMDRFGQASNVTSATFGDLTTGATPSDAVEFRPVVSRNIVPAGFGRSVLHVSHVPSHSFIIRNDGLNTLKYQFAYNIAEGEVFVLDDAIGSPTLLPATTAPPIQFTRKVHRMIMQIASNVEGQVNSARVQYHGFSI